MDGWTLRLRFDSVGLALATALYYTFAAVGMRGYGSGCWYILFRLGVGFLVLFDSFSVHCHNMINHVQLSTILPARA